MKALKLTVCTLLLGSLFPVLAQPPVLTVDGGQVQGVMDEEGVAVYKGIPYAAPPTGDLRWKQPQPVHPWQGVRQCHTWGNASFQGGQQGPFYWKEFYPEDNPPVSEDCLYLNVWTPAVGKQDANLPVMFWIHGGGFQNGYGYEMEMDGDALAKKGVVLVTINYRLGMCGFLAHPLLTAENDGKGSGNYGLFDQLAALKWVKKNIAAFGGNPDNVTAFGQSAGAGSVQALISSPLTKGYIQRAIIQSGGGLGGIIAPQSLADAEQSGKAVWDAACMPTLEQMRSCPSARTQEEVLLNYMITGYEKKQITILRYTPCVDGQLLTASFDETALAGRELDIPYMIGYTSDDIDPERMKKAAVDWSLLLEKQGRKPAYVYCFSRDLPGKDLKDMDGNPYWPGAFHSAELWYMFGTLDRCWRPMEQADYELSDRIISYWTNFAKTGNPNGQGVPQWDPCTQANNYIQVLDVK